MVHYKPVKVIIDTPSLVEVIINMIIRHYGFLDSIITKQKSLCTSKFWLLLYYFLGIKQKLSTAFYPQTNGQTERQNSIIKAYFCAFIKFEQNNWARLIFMAEFTYNYAKNTNTDHISFKLNYVYYPCVFYKKDLNSHTKSKTARKLFSELQTSRPFTNKTFTTSKNFRSKPIIRGQALNLCPKWQSLVV